MISTLILGGLALTANAILVAPPSGPYAVSMSVQALTDESRLDPFAPADDPHSRRLMISTFMPVDEAKTPCIGRNVVPYMTPLVAQAFDQVGVASGLPNGTFSSLEMDFCTTRKSPCRPPRSRAPLVLFSPGFGNPRLLYGAMARDIASHGYAVVTIDHPYDPSFVEFPDGTVYRAKEFNENNITAIQEVTQVRADDASFVLTHLHENPVPGIDVKNTIMMGHSLGGATAATAMHSDPRILGGMDLDGMLFNPALEEGVDKPFLLVGRKGHDDEDPTWDVFYNATQGKKAQIAVEGTTHASFSDYPTLIKSLVTSLNMTLPEEAKTLLESELGTLEFGRSSEVVAGIVTAFGDFVLDDKVGPIFTSGDSTYPEVSVVKASL